jgi:hypothetical protein
VRTEVDVEQRDVGAQRLDAFERVGGRRGDPTTRTPSCSSGAQADLGNPGSSSPITHRRVTPSGWIRFGDQELQLASIVRAG